MASLFVASKHIEDKDKVVHDELVIIAAFPSAIVLLILGGIKIYISDKMHCRALKNDGMSSIAGGILSLSIVIDILVMKAFPKFWYIDAIFAIIMAIFIGFLGLKVLIINPWWRRSFWVSTHGSVVIEHSFGAHDTSKDQLTFA
mmetsp:Transcript_24885/g.30436  ORF Transcript_24885/g.30436 Transcript_24885/m.30436 type:complete len:144 (+) Transcript_24885:42-473(+)